MGARHTHHRVVAMTHDVILFASFALGLVASFGGALLGEEIAVRHLRADRTNPVDGYKNAAIVFGALLVWCVTFAAMIQFLTVVTA
jgi:uncharacterized protein YcsI (UPF0317 family)